MTNDIYYHLSVIATHLAKKIVEDEGIDEFFKSPTDIAVVCHKKRYVKKQQFNKMLTHLSEYEYLESRGEVYVLPDEWRKVLPAKLTSTKTLGEFSASQFIVTLEHLAKHFLAIIRNDQQKLELAKLVYYLDSMNGSKKLQEIRSECISILNSVNTTDNILNISFGLGYSAIQLAYLHEKAQVYSLQLNSSLRDAFNYTITRDTNTNLTVSSSYPSEMINKLMKEKVKYIYVFNPIGLTNPTIERYLQIANQAATDGTKIIMQVPLSDQPKKTLIAEWLAECIESVDEYKNLDYYKVILNKHKFYYDKKLSTDEFVIATYQSE
ncbi:MAG: hypothetical protein FK733_13800 [Asgard group archaeon]|nr:hypothetical protein [Asgard group archaeon]